MVGSVKWLLEACGMNDAAVRVGTRRRFRLRYPLVAVLAVPLLAAAVHLAVCEAAHDGSSYVYGYCQVCGKFRIDEPEVSAFGLVPLPRDRHIEDNECSRFLARRFGVKCAEHRWIFGGGTNTRFEAGHECWFDSFGGWAPFVANWRPAFITLLERLSAREFQDEDLHLWVCYLIKQDETPLVPKHLALELLKLKIKAKGLQRASPEELSRIQSFRDLLPPDCRDNWPELRAQILAELNPASTIATSSGS